MSKHDESDFHTAFGTLVKVAYSDIFDLRGDDAWTMSKDQLTGYFRSADKTSDIIGGRQAGVFVALRELAGFATEKSQVSGNPKFKANNAKASKTPAKQSKSTVHKVSDNVAEHALSSALPNTQKNDIALTVRIEINLPSEGTKETYDAIFKSIKANLYP